MEPDAALNILECDDECKRIERNRKMMEALALGESRESLNVSAAPYSEELLKFARENLAWTQKMEEKIAEFVSNLEENHIYFPSNLKRFQNTFLVSLAPHYNLHGECVDASTSTPNVIFRKKKDLVAALPARLVSEACMDESIQENSEDHEDTTKHIVKLPMNALYFSNLQMGLEAPSICAFLASILGASISMVVLDEIPETDCVIQFKNEKTDSYVSPKKLEEILMNAMFECEQKWIKQSHCVKDIKLCRVNAEKEIMYLTKPKSVILNVGNQESLPMQNTFALLEN
jgi:hypothetical protein